MAMFMMRVVGVVVGVGFSLTAQQLAWRLPERGAAEYAREGQDRASEVCASASLARSAGVTDKLPARYLHRRPPAPWVCQGELQTDQRALAGPVADLRDVLRALACDLGSRSAAARFPRVLPFGDVAVRGSWSNPDEQGRQRLEARVAVKLPGRAGGEDRDAAARLAALCVADAGGSLVLTRRIDAERGLVLDYEGVFDLTVEEDTRAFRRLQIGDRWQLVAVRENQDFDFRKRVAAAITGGTTWVKAAIADGESYLVDRRGERNYGSGRLALALLTLLHGHVPADDPVVQNGFAELRRRRIDDAYSLATALMAMAALRARSSPTERDLKQADKWLRQLLQCTDPRADAALLLRFNYTEGPRYDTSLQQYGLLGMRAAQQCGLVVPGETFAKAARHLLAVQAPGAGSLTLLLTSHEQLRQALGGATPPKPDRHRVRPRGFAYQEPDEPSFGSMTSAGVSGLLLAREGLLHEGGGGGDKRLLEQIDAAILAGFAWLAEHFSVRLNPGHAERADNHQGYWLYCLERCCELRSVALLHDRDWYYEGGLQLLSAQQPNGSFRAGHASTLLLDSTCFAVLFLAKASASGPITGR